MVNLRVAVWKSRTRWRRRVRAARGYYRGDGDDDARRRPARTRVSITFLCLSRGRANTHTRADERSVEHADKPLKRELSSAAVLSVTLKNDGRPQNCMRRTARVIKLRPSADPRQEIYTSGWMGRRIGNYKKLQT